MRTAFVFVFRAWTVHAGAAHSAVIDKVVYKLSANGQLVPVHTCTRVIISFWQLVDIPTWHAPAPPNYPTIPACQTFDTAALLPHVRPTYVRQIAVLITTRTEMWWAGHFVRTHTGNSWRCRWLWWVSNAHYIDATLRARPTHWINGHLHAIIICN